MRTMFTLIVFFLAACGHQALPPDACSAQDEEIKSLQTGNADLIKKVEEAEDAKREIENRSKVYVALTQQLEALRHLADAFIEVSGKRGDQLFICDVVEGEGEGREIIGVAVDIIEGDDPDVGPQTSLMTDTSHLECQRFWIVYDSRGKPSVQWPSLY